MCFTGKTLIFLSAFLSGTVIDNAIMELGTIQAIPNDDLSSIQGDPEKAFFGLQGDGYDFLLVPHGGLKGTSKPVLYRIRLNENAVWGPKGGTALTKENLENFTYQMSYRYGSATKAVREVPIIKYAKKLANQVLSNLKYFDDVHVNDKTLNLKFPVDESEGDDNRPYLSVVSHFVLFSMMYFVIYNVPM